MKYYAGKGKYGKRIGSQINQYLKNHQNNMVYIEPFCGALGVFKHIEHDKYEEILLNDRSIIVDLWDYCLHNQYDPKITEENFNETWKTVKKQSKEDKDNAFFGYGCSWGGIYFSSPCSFREANQQLNTINKMTRLLQKYNDRIMFNNIDYLDFINQIEFDANKEYVFYFDPPYNDTLWLKEWSYKKEELMNVINQLRLLPNVIIFISESSNSQYLEGAKLLTQFSRTNNFNGDILNEYLYIYD